MHDDGFRVVDRARAVIGHVPEPAHAPSLTPTKVAMWVLSGVPVTKFAGTARLWAEHTAATGQPYVATTVGHVPGPTECAAILADYAADYSTGRAQVGAPLDERYFQVWAWVTIPSPFPLPPTRQWVGWLFTAEFRAQALLAMGEDQVEVYEQDGSPLPQPQVPTVPGLTIPGWF